MEIVLSEPPYTDRKITLKDAIDMGVIRAAESKARLIHPTLPTAYVDDSLYADALIALMTDLTDDEVKKLHPADHADIMREINLLQTKTRDRQGVRAFLEQRSKAIQQSRSSSKPQDSPANSDTK